MRARDRADQKEPEAPEDRSVGAAPRMRFNTTITARRAFAFRSVPLADIKLIKNAFGTSVGMIATRGFGRSDMAQRRSTIAWSSGACSGVTTFAPEAARASLSDVKYWKNASPTTMSSIGASPTFRTLKRTTAKTT